MSHVGITSATYGVVTRDGSHLRCGRQTRSHVGGGETGEAARKIEPGWAGPLVPDECCGGKRPMLVVARQEKLLEKLNLDGLAHWSPMNAVVARELVLAYHDVFALESDELGCTSAIEHEMCIENSKPFKERFWRIPPPLLEEMHASLWDMLEAGVIRSSQSPWCNAVVLVRKKDGTLRFCVDFRCLNTWTNLPFAPHSGDAGKHGRVSTFLINGFQVRLLANQDYTGVAAIHSLHSG